jgi:plasmid maintenance system antidote protein VapI
MSYKKLLQEHSPKDLAESFVFPVKLSAKQQKTADRQLAEARQKAREKMTDAEKLTGRLMGLKFQMEDYFRAEKPNAEYSFGYFLKLYIELLDMKRRGFAKQIGIDETLLSQLINQRRVPPEYIPIRLELHSNNSIPAEYWYRVIEKDREGTMLLNKAAMRKKEMKYVTGGVSVRL